MTYIMLSDDMRLTITQLDTIYRGDNMNKKITFLLPEKVGELETASSMVLLSYIRADGSPDIVVLDREDEMYNQYYHKYVLPVTCKLSRYPGEVCMWLQFYSGNTSSPAVSKSGECVIRVSNTKNLDDCLSDHQITAMYQLKKKLDKLQSTHNEDISWGDMSENTPPSQDPSSDSYWEDM